MDEKLDKNLIYKVSAYSCVNCGGALHKFKESPGLVISQCDNCGHKNKFLPNGARE